MANAKTKKIKKLSPLNYGYAKLTRHGLIGEEPVFINPANVTWVEPASANMLAQGTPPFAGTGNTSIHLSGQPLMPLVVAESVEKVLETLNKAAFD